MNMKRKGKMCQYQEDLQDVGCSAGANSNSSHCMDATEKAKESHGVDQIYQKQNQNLIQNQGPGQTLKWRFQEWRMDGVRTGNSETNRSTGQNPVLFDPPVGSGDVKYREGLTGTRDARRIRDKATVMGR